MPRVILEFNSQMEMDDWVGHHARRLPAWVAVMPVDEAEEAHRAVVSGQVQSTVDALQDAARKLRKLTMELSPDA